MNLTKRRVLGSVDLLLLKEIGANRRQPCCLLLLAFCTRVRSEPTRNWTEPRLAQARSSSFLIFYSDCNPSPPSSPATAQRRQRPPMEGLSGAESIRSSVNLGSLQLGKITGENPSSTSHPLCNRNLKEDGVLQKKTGFSAAFFSDRCCSARSATPQRDSKKTQQSRTSV